MDALFAGFEIKKLKNFVGREGHGFNLDLHLAGKKIASVLNGGDGGCLSFYWEGKTREERDANMKAYTDRVAQAGMVEIPEEMAKHGVEPYPHTDDSFVCAMVDDYLNEKKLRRQCKTHTLIIMSHFKKDEYGKVNRPYTPALAAELRRLNGDKLLEIINERYL